MNVIIIEDEIPAVNRLAKLLQACSNDIAITQRFDSVETSVRFLTSANKTDLIFMDIQLADGLCFSIFEQVKVNTPVIFTTAFDQYTLKAFKVNSIDYLLKPIEEGELYKAINKFRSLHEGHNADFAEKMRSIIQQLSPVKFKERLLIKGSEQLGYLKTEDIAYCYAAGKFCFAVDYKNQQHLLEQNLTELETELDPSKFFRVNRNLMVAVNSLAHVHLWFGGRLKLELTVQTTTDTIVSRERVADFKEWLGGK